MAKQGQADRFHQGTMTDGWRWFGAHPAKKRGRDGWTFRVWAPHAEAVSVVGDFNDPAKAKCDGAQSLTPDQFDELMGFITKEVEFFGKKMN